MGRVSRNFSSWVGFPVTFKPSGHTSGISTRTLWSGISTGTLWSGISTRTLQPFCTAPARQAEKVLGLTISFFTPHNDPENRCLHRDLQFF